MPQEVPNDRFGIGWRPDLAAAILRNLDRIDVLEVIADDYFGAPSRIVKSLASLSAEHPVVLHAVGMGMASTIRTGRSWFNHMARLVDRVKPESWSEHLAFVRAGGVEIGHLAAPPRNANSLEGTLANLEAATRATGMRPAMENIATLVDPPGSSMTEAEWLSRVALDSGGPLLLDLHNVHANAVNCGFDAMTFLRQVPLERVSTIHLSGGRWIGTRILDDHLHDVPDPVYDMLRFVAGRAPRPLTVLLERDGKYPPIEHLLAQLDRARQAVMKGRREHAGI